MSDQLSFLRRKAKTLKNAFLQGDLSARQTVQGIKPQSDGQPLKHADFLHVVARIEGFRSWPDMKLAVESQGMDRAAKQARLRIALFQGQHWVVKRLLSDTPDLAKGQFALLCALFDHAGVAQMLKADPSLATQMFAPRRPILHLAYSQHLQAAPQLESDMLAIAQLLVSHGADVNDGFAATEGDSHMLSALYGALGHAGNMPLARWLLENGADPNDNESLYHATELGHSDGVALLLTHGAKPDGTNALLRAMDFNNHDMVRQMIAAGASVRDGLSVPPLHHAAQRSCDAEMVDILLQAGADPSQTHDGATAYGYARVFGNASLAKALESHGQVPALSPEETLLARAADGLDSPGQWIDTAKLPEAYRTILGSILTDPSRLDHVKRLVALGIEYDRPGSMGLTPVQVAGWEGLPQVMGYFLRQMPDLSHVNDFGGTLFSTILHGSENCPARAQRDHVTCLQMALEHGVALPRAALKFTGNEDVAALLADWAEAHPGQVVEHGIV